jgi:hypothetical protein
MALYDAGSVYNIVCNFSPIPLATDRPIFLRLGHSLYSTSHNTFIAKLNTSSTRVCIYLMLPPFSLTIITDALATLEHLLAS